MSSLFWLALAVFASSLLWINGAVHALTPEEVLKLKAAGVSEETLQMMLRNDRENKISADKLEQGYATDHMGTWKLKDGRTITSTGKRRLPLHYPTDYPPPSPYAPYIYPHIGLPAGETWQRSTPLPPFSPQPPETPFRPRHR